MKKVVVTGSDGQLGRTLREFAQNAKNTLFDFKTSADLDITNEHLVSDFLNSEEYKYCINCAAYTNVEQAEKDPGAAYLINSEGAKNLALACKAYQVKLIHVSTDYVFDGEKKTPYTVEDQPNPINVYGKSKLKGEEYIRRILPNHFIVRTSWLYSKKYGHNFYRTILRKALEGDDLRVTDDQKGCPTNTETLTKFILDDIIGGKKPYGTYHCTDGVPMTWYDFAQKILKENGLSDKVNLVLDRNYRTFARRPKNSVLS